MRTQLILTTAAIGVASSFGAFGQVYSVNAVGYINVKVGAGKYSIVANQLNVGGNTLKEVLPTAPDGTIVFKYSQAAGFDAIIMDFGLWGKPDATVKPGEGFFVQNNGTTELTLTFVGEVPQGTLTTGLLAGLNMVSSQVPQGGKLSADLAFPAADGDIVYQWDAVKQTYKDANVYDFGSWGGGDPLIAVGEGYFVSKAAAGSWVRTFSVN